MKKRDKYFILVDCRENYATVSYNLWDSLSQEKRWKTVYCGIDEKNPYELWFYEWSKDAERYLIFGMSEGSRWSEVYNIQTVRTFNSLAEAKLACVVEGIECFAGKRSLDVRKLDAEISFSNFKKKFERIF